MLSILLHALATVLLQGTEVWPDPVRPHSLGFAGSLRVVDLAPLEEIHSNQLRIARIRLREGALLATDIEAVAPPETRRRIDPRARRSEEPAPQTRREPRPADPEPVRFELREDWTSAIASSPQARSEDLQAVRIVRPQYPPAAIWGNIEGLVRLEVRIDELGLVRDVQVVDRPPDGRPLADAAVEAMWNWRFRPYRIGGQLTPFTVVVPFRFRLVD